MGHEGISQQRQSPHETGIEATANYEGNDSLATINRARNRTIRNQIIELLYQQEVLESDALKNEEWEPYLPEGWTGKERFSLRKGKRSGRITDSAYLESALKTPLPTHEEIARKLDEEINQVATVTEVEFSSRQPSSDRMTTEWKTSKGKPTTKQMSIIEAHEKGHRIRPYHDRLKPIFMKGFDLSKVELRDEDYEALAYEWEQNVNAGRAAEEEGRPLSKDEWKQSYLRDYLFTPNELAERMSQLKNYFGMQGHELFTKGHLDYAREHYVKDVGLDNGMTLFFQAVTPETQDAFVELMNTAGI